MDPSAVQAPRIADGESFTYALYLKQGLLTVRAGTASLNVTKKGDSYEAVLEFRTAAVVDMVYHLAVRMSTLLTPDLKPIIYVKHAEEGSSVYDETIEFSTPGEGGCMVSARRVFKDGKTDTGVVSRPVQVFDLVSLTHRPACRVGRESHGPVARVRRHGRGGKRRWKGPGVRVQPRVGGKSADGAFGFFARREPRPATHRHRAEVRFRVRTAPVTRNTTDYFFGSSVAFSFFA